MVLDPRKRQQKLLKQRQKDTARKKAAAQAPKPFETLSPTEKIRTANRFPIMHCAVNSDWKKSGLASVVIARRQPDDLITFGVFLVDILCLGVKSCFANVDFTQLRFEEELLTKAWRGQGPPVNCPVPLAHRIIYGARDYAAGLGFSSDPDFELARHVLDPPEKHQDGPDVEFGRDGKPFFIAGPHDDSAAVIRILERSAGSGS